MCIKSIFLKIINKLSFHFKFIKCNRSRREKVNDLQEDGKVCFWIPKPVYEEKTGKTRKPNIEICYYRLSFSGTESS